MTQSETTKAKTNRMISIDIIRLFSMIAISHFHIHEATFFSDIHDHAKHGFFEHPLVWYSRFMAFSGFSIIFISYFLIGLIGLKPKKVKKLLGIAIAGTLTLFIVYFEGGTGEFEWDIYPFIAVSSLLLFLVNSIPFGILCFSFLGLMALALPPDFWNFPELKNHFYYNAAFGDYNSYGKGSWPLLPWAGLPILSFGAGKIIRLKSQLRDFLTSISKLEVVIWVALIGFSIPQWGAFLPVPIGAGFYKFVQNLGRVDIFSHMIVVIFFVRLGFLTKFNRWATAQPLLKWVSNLQLNQRFFLFYIVNWAWIGVFSHLENLYYQTPVIFDLVLILLFPLTELTCGYFLKFSDQIYPRLKLKLRGAQ